MSILFEMWHGIRIRAERPRCSALSRLTAKRCGERHATAFINVSRVTANRLRLASYPQDDDHAQDDMTYNAVVSVALRHGIDSWGEA